jgi:hypothetical protein
MKIYCPKYEKKIQEIRTYVQVGLSLSTWVYLAEILDSLHWFRLLRVVLYLLGW